MIDWSRVDELRAEIGGSDFADVVALFFEEADEAVERLATADHAGIEGAMHFLKGSALNLGLADLAALCQAGERAARAGNGCTVDVAEVAACYRASKSAFLSGRRQTAA